MYVPMEVCTVSSRYYIINTLYLLLLYYRDLNFTDDIIVEIENRVKHTKLPFLILVVQMLCGRDYFTIALVTISDLSAGIFVKYVIVCFICKLLYKSTQCLLVLHK